MRSGTNAYIVDYVIYVSAALVFAGLAGLFVTTLAPYAAGSGIPEVSEGRETVFICSGYKCVRMSLSL